MNKLTIMATIVALAPITLFGQTTWTPAWSTAQLGSGVPTGFAVDNVTPVKVRVGPDGNVYVLSKSAPLVGFTLDKINSSGTVLASVVYNGASNFTLQQAQNANAQTALPVDMTIDSNGNIDVAVAFNGTYLSNVPCNVSQFNSSLTLVNQVVVSAPTGDQYYPVAIRTGTNNNVFLLADHSHVSGSTTYDELMLAKFDSSLNEASIGSGQSELLWPGISNLGANGHYVTPVGDPVKSVSASEVNGLYVSPDATNGDRVFVAMNSGYGNLQAPYANTGEFIDDGTKTFVTKTYVEPYTSSGTKWIRMEDISGDSSGVYVAASIGGHYFSGAYNGSEAFEQRIASISNSVMTLQTQSSTYLDYATSGDLVTGPNWNGGPVSGVQDANLVIPDGNGDLYVAGMSKYPIKDLNPPAEYHFQGGTFGAEIVNSTSAYVSGWNPPIYYNYTDAFGYNWGTHNDQHHYSTSVDGAVTSNGLFVLGTFVAASGTTNTSLVQYSTTASKVKYFNTGGEANPKCLAVCSSGEIYALSGYSGNVVGPSGTYNQAILRRFTP